MRADKDIFSTYVSHMRSKYRKDLSEFWFIEIINKLLNFHMYEKEIELYENSNNKEI